MDISDRIIVKKYKNKKNEIHEDELKESDITYQKNNSSYKIGGLSALDLNFKDYYEIHSEDPDKSFKSDSLPLMKWLSTVCDTKIDFKEAKKQNRVKGDGKGPWPSEWIDNEYTEHYLLLTNDIVNIDFFVLQNHPKLQWLLMNIVGIGNIQNHQWLSLSNIKNNNKTELLDEIIKEVYPSISYRELDFFKKINNENDIEEIAKKMGKDDNELKKIMEEFKKWKEVNL